MRLIINIWGRLDIYRDDFFVRNSSSLVFKRAYGSRKLPYKYSKF